MILSGKTVLITGGRRIGAGLARQLAERGMNIAVSYRTSREEMRTLVADCQQMGVQADAFQADLCSSLEAERLVDWTVETFGSIDILINLTSIYHPTPFASLQPSDYEAMLAANLTAPYWVAVAAARAMLRQSIVGGLRGKIIHFTDWAVDRPYRDYLPYLIAKGGLVTLTKALAVELAPTITVNAVAPGTVEPPPNLPKRVLQKICESSALNRIGCADDVIRATLFLLEGTDFVTGEVFRIDGGRFLGSSKTSAGEADQL